MFGQNEVTSPFPKADGSLLVTEVWRTIQGEGPDAGTPAIFVRLSKCNLRCYFCDTEFDKGEWYSVGDLLVKVFKLAVAKIRLVVLTGGEPLLQNINPFVSGCNANGIRVSVETAGTTVQPGLEYFFGPKAHIKNLIVCSPKTPKLNEELLPLIGAFKYIVSPTTVDLAGDGLPSASTQLQDKPE